MRGPHEKNYYEHASHWDVARFDRGFESERLATTADLVPSAVRSVLDVGAGNGSFLKILEQRRENLSMIGIERSVAAVQAARCQAPIIRGLAEDLPFLDRAFDLVSALETIEHLPYGTYERALGELRRVASKYILISVPYRERRLRTICPYCTCEFNPHYHMWSYDEMTLSGLVPGFGIAASTKVYCDESFLKILVRPFRRRIFSDFPVTAFCPQCGYRSGGDTDPSPIAENGRIDSGRSLIKAIAEKLPVLRVARDTIVLFEKHES